MANSTINQLTAVSVVTNQDEVEVQKIGESSTKKATVAQLTFNEAQAREVQDNIIENAVGLTELGTYPGLPNSWYLRESDQALIVDRTGVVNDLPSNVMSALRMLDYQIHNTNANVSSFIKTILIRAGTSNVLSMNAVPFVMIPARSGYTTEIISIYGKNGFNTNPFEAGSSKVEVKYRDGATMFEFDNSFIEASADAYHRGIPTTNYALSPVTDVVAFCGTAPAGGNGFLEFTVTYRQHAI
jgi:hypothetical protein